MHCWWLISQKYKDKHLKWKQQIQTNQLDFFKSISGQRVCEKQQEKVLLFGFFMSDTEMFKWKLMKLNHDPLGLQPCSDYFQAFF